MSYKPDISYDPVNKIWTGAIENDHFAPDLSLGELIFHEMRRHPKQVAQISVTENTVLTREELLQNSMRIACFLRNAGCRQSDVVGIIARSTTHIAAVAYACFFNGTAIYCLDPIQSDCHFKALCQTTKANIIFCDGEVYERVRKIANGSSVSIITMNNHSVGSIPIEKVLETGVEKNFRPLRLENGINQTLAILSTSGTTSVPKAVTISNSRKMLNSSLMLTTEDVQYVYNNLSWSTGLRVAVTSAVFSTTRIIDDSKDFDPVLALHLIEKYKVTWTILPPAYLALIVACPEFEKANLDSLRYVMHSGERCSLDVQYRLRKRLRGDFVHNAYALTETGTWATINWNFDEKPTSVGRLTSGFQLKLLNEKNEPLSPNEVGEICLRTNEYWGGYIGNLEESKHIRDSDLWFHTGDLGYMDSDGFLYFVERKKNLLRFQYMDFFPIEIEEIISQMPQVIDVCAFGIWNRIDGDCAAAAVVKKPGFHLTDKDVVDYVDRHEPKFYRKLHGGALIVDKLQRNPNGKTNRRLTKAYFMEVKGLREE